jgi:uncharacterized membrane protein
MMATQIISWLFAIPLLGLTTGLRTMTPIAVLCWFAYLGRLPVQGTWASWTAHLATVILFTLFALGELIGDKLPRTPNRTAPGPLVSRLIFGSLVGSIAATAMRGPALEGAVLGVVGAALGTFAGFMIRRDLVKRIGGADLPIAVTEDLFAVVCTVLAMHMITS